MADERRKPERRKPPAYQHYAKDWLVDTAHLTLEEQGAYTRLLDNQWVNGVLPSTERDRAALLSVTLVTFRRIWRRIGRYFPAGANPRLEEIRQELEAYRERQSNAGKSSARGRVVGVRLQPDINQEATTPQPTPESGCEVVQPEGNSSPSSSPSKVKSIRTPWVTGMGQLWTAAYGGTPPYGQLGKHLKPLVTEHGVRPVGIRFRNYLRATEAKYASPARFAQTYGSWGEPGGASAPDSWISPDSARLEFRKAGIPENWPVNPDGYKTRPELDEAIRVRVQRLPESA